MNPRTFQQAAGVSLDERWLLMSKAKTIEEMRKIYDDTECALCKLQAYRQEVEVSDGKFDCCSYLSQPFA